MSDRDTLQAMFARAGVRHMYDPEWNVIVMEAKGGNQDICFLFDDNGNLYSLPEEDLPDFRAAYEARFKEIQQKLKPE